MTAQRVPCPNCEGARCDLCKNEGWVYAVPPRVQAAGECPLSKRVDGPLHSWGFDGDDPYMTCCFCGERRDAITGRVLTRGRTT